MAKGTYTEDIDMFDGGERLFGPREKQTRSKVKEEHICGSITLFNVVR